MIALLCILASCSCPSFDALEVLDPSGVANAAQLEAIDDAVRNFASWTDREGVCVPAVEVVSKSDPRMVDGYPGLYQGPGNPVLVAVNETPDVEQTTRHELCHALDGVERISDDHPGVFPATEDSYWGDPAEQFAYACEEHPRDIEVAMGLHLGCGLGAVAAQESMVLELVFPGVAVRDGPLGVVEVAAARTPVTLPWSGPPAAVGSSSGRGLAVGTPSDGAGVAFVVLDPAGGRAAEIALGLSAPDARWCLVADTEHAYVFAEDSRSGAVRVDLASLAVTPAEPPPTAGGDSVTRGTMLDGEMWLVDAARERPELVRWQPEAGREVERVVLDEPTSARFAPGGVTDGVGLVGDGDTLWMSAYRGLLSYSIATGETSYYPLPAPGFFHFRLTRQGSFLVTFGIFHGDPRTFLLAFDTADGTWHLPADPCGAASVEFDPLLVEDGAAATMWDNGPDEEPSTRDDWYFSTISVGSP